MKADYGLTHLLARTGSILLDFDGPVCSVFASYPAAQVATELRDVLAAAGVEPTPPVAVELDPLEVLRWVGGLGRPDVTRAVEDALCAAELRAVHTAAPTPYGREVIVAARQAGRQVAVVSNNSEPAIAMYLAEHRLEHHISSVVGRAYGEPDRMKPNAAPILQAVNEIGAAPADCVLVGDSITDITGAQAAGVNVIAYANKPRKVSIFDTAAADVVITGMDRLAAALLPHM